MKTYLVTVTERDGRRYVVAALATSTCDACMQVLEQLGRIVGISGRRA
ncbi:hypothetical protein [Aquitalea magnusonii]|jgi:hypothetical protein|uniref:Transposase n=1 Tax=Aquitalea magnusonii TaxID=332411 RepID=A0A318J4D6_9NEIS|nr:hypothetical protein [Aquitalea magnusonii]PXX42242.1 hypothetical protein DFR38_12039 [Aquitalea magnusonii]